MSELKAGQELDALIAERVMGWARHRDGVRGQLRFHPQDAASPTGSYPVDVGAGEEWSPSTEIRDAWQVAEKLRIAVIPVRESGWLAGPISEMQDWVDESMGVVDIHLEPYAFEESAPLAICRAALKAAESRART